MDNTNAYEILVIFISYLTMLGAENCGVEPQTKTLRFSLQSRRNLTGHWIAEVQMEHGDVGAISGRSWELGVEQSITTGCGGQVVSVAATVSGPPPKPPPDYEFFPGVGYYKLHKEGRKWTEALEICAKENAHLAVLNSQLESDVLKGMFSRHSSKLSGVNDQNLAFIGFHDLFHEGEFITVLGTSLNSTGFLTWSDPSQPNNSNAGPDPDSDCGGISRNGAAMSPSGGPDISYVPNSGTANYCGVLRGIGSGAAAYHVEWELCTSRHSFICERPYTPQGLNIIIKPFKHVIKKVWAGLFD